jgi:class 3 adenylate cyclase
MANYRTTVILKTDIVDSTPKLAEQTQAEMGLQRKQHKQFITEVAIQHRGSVFDEEGDAYWIEFPSVTDATLAAIDMHQNLRSMQAGKGEKQRLAIRAVITVGDILHQEKDTIGMTMSQTVRIEKFTPPDEIYLSYAAWLVLNKAEVQTSLVGEFNLKGFSETEKVYKVDQKNSVRVLTNQYIIFTDIRGWSTYTQSKDTETLISILTEYDDLMNEICDKNGGVIRNASGDQYFLTFSDTERLFLAVEELCASWKNMVYRYQLGLSVGIHKGDLNIIRSYLFSNDIHTTIFLERLNSLTYPDKETISVVTTGKVKENALNTKWAGSFREIDSSLITNERIQLVINEHDAYWFVPKADMSR